MSWSNEIVSGGDGGIGYVLSVHSACMLDVREKQKKEKLDNHLTIGERELHVHVAAARVPCTCTSRPDGCVR